MSDSLLQIRGLGKWFGPHKVFSGVNLDIDQGEVVTIIGSSGSGKTTLLRCINLLETFQEGTIHLNGEELGYTTSGYHRRRLSEAHIANQRIHTGMVFQQFNLFPHMTVMKNVTLGLVKVKGMDRQSAEAEAEKWLTRVGLAEKINSYPSQLSGGQQQRVAIARAIAMNPLIMLFDEATSALDPSTTRGVLELLKSINRRLGITIVVITHEMSVIEEICHRVAIIDDSRIAEVGSVADVFANPKTAAGRRLVYPGERPAGSLMGSRCCRIVFEGNASSEPVIANMVLEFREPVNILYADTRDIDGKAYGQIVIQLPASEQTGDRMLEYLRQRGLKAEEVDGFV